MVSMAPAVAGLVCCWFVPQWATTIAVFCATIMIFSAIFGGEVAEIAPPTEPRTARGSKPTDFPPPFPNGWFAVCPSSHLERGQVKPLEMVGHQLVVFRAQNGEAAVLDAFCPHLGAHLGVGGEVRGDCIRCPFHGWEFSTEGECTHIPANDGGSIPKGSSLRMWPTMESHGMLFLWHSVDSPEEPTWSLQTELDAFLPAAKVANNSYYFGGYTQDMVHCHVQEIPENGADSAHLNILHREFVVPWLRPAFTHLWSASWEPSVRPHVSQMKLDQYTQLWCRSIPGTLVRAKIAQVGPGVVVLQLSACIGTAVVMEFVSPCRCTSQRVFHTIHAQSHVPSFVARGLFWSLTRQFRRDIPIWENKKFVGKPPLCKADGPISAFRSWFRQFYSPNSLTFADAYAKEHMMDW